MIKCVFKGKGLHCHLFGGKIICNNNCRHCKAYESGDEMTRRFGRFVAFESDRSGEEKPTLKLALKFLKGWKLGKC